MLSCYLTRRARRGLQQTSLVVFLHLSHTFHGCERQSILAEKGFCVRRLKICTLCFLRILNSSPADRLYRKHIQSAPIDISRGAQLRAIDASFAAANDNFDMSALRHPNNPDITAVESYPILPDAEVWPNQYDLFRFSERPGDRPKDVRHLFTRCSETIGSSFIDRRKTNVWIARFYDL